MAKATDSTFSPWASARRRYLRDNRYRSHIHVGRFGERGDSRMGAPNPNVPPSLWIAPECILEPASRDKQNLQTVSAEWAFLMTGNHFVRTLHGL